jgi:hypothetical protein
VTGLKGGYVVKWIFLEGLQNYIFLYEADGFKFLGFLVDAKINIKILLTSMEKKLTNSEDCTESSRRILFWLSFLSAIGGFSPVPIAFLDKG